MSDDPRNDAPRVTFPGDPGCQAAWDRHQARKSDSLLKPEEATIGVVGCVARSIADLDRKLNDPTEEDEHRWLTAAQLTEWYKWLRAVPRFHEFETYLQTELQEESLVGGIEKARKTLAGKLKMRFPDVDRMPMPEAMDILKGPAPLVSLSVDPERQDISPVICSQAAIAKWMGKCKTYSKYLERLKAAGVVKDFGKQGSRFAVWFTDPATHARALEEISEGPKPRKA